VNISARAEYACLALLELAVHHPANTPLCARQIADVHGIPLQFLVQILSQLKSAGLVSSTRGAGGGYRLTKDPGEMSLADVLAVVDGNSGEPTSTVIAETGAARVLLAIWRRISAVQREILESLTLADLAEETREPAGNMYYI
jgi:Rrf2 family protein